MNFFLIHQINLILEIHISICLNIQLSISSFLASQDVVAKLMSFSQSTSKAVCVLSANGSISNVSLRQGATSGGTVTYEVCISMLTIESGYVNPRSNVSSV